MGGINHLAVWIAGVVHFLLGAAWYSTLSQAWLDGIGRTEEEIVAAQGASPLPYILGLAAGVIIAYTLARLIPGLGKPTAANGAAIGVALALALIGSTLAMNYGFEARPLSLWLINTGYMTVGMAISGAIIGGWKRKTKL
jgi:uncharacterized protein YacL